jgi:hypothetical protein
MLILGYFFLFFNSPLFIFRCLESFFKKLSFTTYFYRFVQWGGLIFWEILVRDKQGIVRVWEKKISHLLEPEINDVEIKGKNTLNLREKMLNNYILTEKKYPL